MEIPVSEKLHFNRLNSKNIVIEEIYKNDNDEILVRSTDGLRNDTIINCKRIEKRYFHNAKGIYIQKNFDKDATYTYYMGRKDDTNIKCPNCGYRGKKVEFFDGCPYCGTNTNIDYKIKEVGVIGKYKEMLNNKKYQLIIFIFALIETMLFLAIPNDDFPIIIKIIISLGMLPMMLAINHLIFSILLIPYFIIFIATGGKKDTIISKLNKVDKTIMPVKLLNDLEFELNSYYYDDVKNPEYSDLIDFDIIKYESVKMDNEKDLIIKCVIRNIFFRNNKIFQSIVHSKVKLKRNILNKLVQSKDTIVKCNNCGASISITSKECEYCNTPTNFKNEWEIDEIIID